MPTSDLELGLVDEIQNWDPRESRSETVSELLGGNYVDDPARSTLALKLHDAV